MIKTVGFIGLGNMGYPMALNLRRSLSETTTLYVHDVVRDKAEQFRLEAATAERQTQHLRPDSHHNSSNSTTDKVVILDNAREVADKSDVILTIVPEGSHVRDVFLGANGILSNLTSNSESGSSRSIDGKTFIDCSTIDAATSLLIARSVEEACPGGSARFYDAPVSGGTPGAAAGTLTFMVGASEDDEFFRTNIRPLLMMMGKNIFCLGGPGKGLIAKLSNNYLSGLIAIATSEAMNLGMRYGIDPKVLSECFKKSSGGNWVNDTVNPVPGVCPNAVTSHGYQGGFKIQLMKKDFSLAVQSAKEAGAKLVLGDAGLQTYAAAAEDPMCRDLDSRVVYRWLGGKEPE